METCDAIQPELDAYLDGEVSSQQRTALEAHLRDCAACRAMLADLESVRGALTDLPRLKAPGSLAAGIRRKIAAMPPDVLASPAAGSSRVSVLPQSPSAQARQTWRAGLMAIAALLMAAVLIFLLLPQLLTHDMSKTASAENSRVGAAAPPAAPEAGTNKKAEPASDQGEPSKPSSSIMAPGVARADAPASGDQKNAAADDARNLQDWMPSAPPPGRAAKPSATAMPAEPAPANGDIEQLRLQQRQQMQSNAVKKSKPESSPPQETNAQVNKVSGESQEKRQVAQQLDEAQAAAKAPAPIARKENRPSPAAPQTAAPPAPAAPFTPAPELLDKTEKADKADKAKDRAAASVEEDRGSDTLLRIEKSEKPGDEIKQRALQEPNPRDDNAGQNSYGRGGGRVAGGGGGESQENDSPPHLAGGLGGAKPQPFQDARAQRAAPAATPAPATVAPPGAATPGSIATPTQKLADGSVNGLPDASAKNDRLPRAPKPESNGASTADLAEGSGRANRRMATLPAPIICRAAELPGILDKLKAIAEESNGAVLTAVAAAAAKASPETKEARADAAALPQTGAALEADAEEVERTTEKAAENSARLRGEERKQYITLQVTAAQRNVVLGKLRRMTGPQGSGADGAGSELKSSDSFKDEPRKRPMAQNSEEDELKKIEQPTERKATGSAQEKPDSQKLEAAKIPADERVTITVEIRIVP